MDPSRQLETRKAPLLENQIDMGVCNSGSRFLAGTARNLVVVTQNSGGSVNAKCETRVGFYVSVISDRYLPSQSY